MAAKFRVGATLANHVQDLGYKGGDLGYQTFLYSNETEIRKILMFLVEKLPKETSQTSDEPMGAGFLLQKAVSTELAAQLSLPWLPPFLKPNGMRRRPRGWHREGACCLQPYHSSPLSLASGTTSLSTKLPKEQRAYYARHLSFVTAQPRSHVRLAPSVMETNALQLATQQDWDNEWNTHGLPSRLSQEEYKQRKRDKLLKMIGQRLQQDSQRAAGQRSSQAQDFAQVLSSIEAQSNKNASSRGKGSRFAHTEKLQYGKDTDATMAQMGGAVTKETEEEVEQKRAAEVQGLREELQTLTQTLEQLDLEVRKFTAGTQQMEEEVATATNAAKDKTAAFNVKKRTLDLLPQAQENIAKLQAVVDGSAARLVTLAQQWEGHRQPLVQQHRDLRQSQAVRESEAEKKLEEIKEFRGRMKAVADEARRKEELAKQLTSEFERMTKDVNRSAYTRKIMEIVANIKKQKQEIDKILVDTKAVQKEINSLSGKLDRTFTVTDELIFKDAKKDEGVKKAYRMLAALHENFEQLIVCVEDTGGVVREIKDLEEQIESESSKKTLTNLEKISEDLQQMKKENAALIAKVKGK